MAITICEYSQTDLSQAVKIGEGKHREVFRLGDKALKILKLHIRKNYGLFHIDFPTNLYTKYRYGIDDFNEFEYRTYKKFIERVPPEFKDRFSRIYHAGRLDGRSFSISDLVVNSDGSLSKPLSEYDIIDSAFWRQIDELEEILASKEIPIMDIGGENIMVKEADGKMIPVIIDFKRYGRKTYPFQIWLFSEQRLISKMRRRFQRLKERYKQ